MVPSTPSKHSPTPWLFIDPLSTPWLFIDPLGGPIDPWGSISTTLRTPDVDAAPKNVYY